eukprot:gene12242-15382_t
MQMQAKSLWTYLWAPTATCPASATPHEAPSATPLPRLMRPPSANILSSALSPPLPTPAWLLVLSDQLPSDDSVSSQSGSSSDDEDLSDATVDVDTILSSAPITKVIDALTIIVPQPSCFNDSALATQVLMGGQPSILANSALATQVLMGGQPSILANSALATQVLMGGQPSILGNSALATQVLMGSQPSLGNSALATQVLMGGQPSILGNSALATQVLIGGQPSILTNSALATQVLMGGQPSILGNSALATQVLMGGQPSILGNSALATQVLMGSQPSLGNSALATQVLMGGQPSILGNSTLATQVLMGGQPSLGNSALATQVLMGGQPSILGNSALATQVLMGGQPSILGNSALATQVLMGGQPSNLATQALMGAQPSWGNSALATQVLMGGQPSILPNKALVLLENVLRGEEQDKLEDVKSGSEAKITIECRKKAPTVTVYDSTGYSLDPVYVDGKAYQFESLIFNIVSDSKIVNCVSERHTVIALVGGEPTTTISEVSSTITTTPTNTLTEVLDIQTKTVGSEGIFVSQTVSMTKTYVRGPQTRIHKTVSTFTPVPIDMDMLQQWCNEDKEESIELKSASLPHMYWYDRVDRSIIHIWRGTWWCGVV